MPLDKKKALFIEDEKDFPYTNRKTVIELFGN
jgi:hypothetical protein